MGLSCRDRGGACRCTSSQGLGRSPGGPRGGLDRARPERCPRRGEGAFNDVKDVDVERARWQKVNGGARCVEPGADDVVVDKVVGIVVEAQGGQGVGLPALRIIEEG